MPNSHLQEVPPPGGPTSRKSPHFQEVVRRLLYTDPIWAAYGIADLQPHLAGDCRWLAAEDANGAGNGALALIYSGLEPPVLFTLGDPSLLAGLLDAADLPPRIYVSIREEHLPVVARHYNLTGDTRPMWRMVLADGGAALREAGANTPSPTRLTGAQAPDVLRLLAHGGPFCPDAFSPAQMDQGVFFGVYAGGDLLAVGGTHVLDRVGSVAAVGNMYTLPDMRRRGHSAAVLGAIVRELSAQGIATVVLNVDQRNAGAQALYLARGFVVHTPYIEGTGTRHA